LVGGRRKPVERDQRDMTFVLETRVQLVRNRAAARMADDVSRISAGLFDFLDHPIELLAEAADGACIIGVRGRTSQSRTKRAQDQAT
jgi:hypothetical protein